MGTIDTYKHTGCIIITFGVPDLTAKSGTVFTPCTVPPHKGHKMSSLTKSQFITQIKTRSSLLAEFTESTLGTFIDIALRAVSELKPEILVDADNAYTEGTDLYDVPSGCLNVTRVIDSDSRKRIEFSIENQGAGDKIRLGNIIKRSYDPLIEQGFYIDPTNSGVVSSDSYTSFDVEYSILQTMTTIKDTSLEAIYNYVLYQACSNRAEGIASSAGKQDTVNTMTDADAEGNSNSFTFASSKEAVSNFTALAESYLLKFLSSVGSAFGIRS